ncbi:hypothetical protein [Streptomyces sp. NPDC020681]|uniref:hypothetical protein n=1 Tax=Streptomyces sp. NPDC020681 TaxID=3365083 RepID=UPI00379F21BA
MMRDGGGVRRGEMAVDHFTRIANALFRDTRISFKAKGIFGLISTHRDGWRVSIGELTRSGRDGRDAVSAGLRELEQFGYLRRERVRQGDGTLGETAYVITDVPTCASGRTEQEAPAADSPDPRERPGPGKPGLGNPGKADREGKNTRPQKHIDQNVQEVLPSFRDEGEHSNPEDARQEPRPSPPASAGEGTCVTPGVDLLLAIGARRPELLLTGQALHDQGQVIDELLEAGWAAAHLEQVIASRPLPQPVRRSVGAIIAARLKAVRHLTPPQDLAATTTRTPERSDARRTHPDRSVPEAVGFRALVECSGCGSPGTAPGSELCPACLDWPPCRGCTGPTPRRAHPAGDGLCSLCTAKHTRNAPHPHGSSLTHVGSPTRSGATAIPP